MLNLVLIRHAKSSWKEDLADFDRGLNKRGEKSIEVMKNHLKNILHYPCFASSAKRTSFTAKGLGFENITFCKDLYLTPLEEYLKIIRSSDKQNLIIIGHNPTITELANHLSDLNLANMPTCSVVFLEFDLREFASIKKASKASFIYPKMFDIEL